MNTVDTPLAAAPRASVTALSHDGRGIARLKGKTLFIEDALPREEVAFRLVRRHREFDEAALVEVIQASADRVAPRCAHFGACGGCVLQHLDPAAQIAAKQQTLLDNLRRIGGVAPREVLAPLTGPVWGYRRRARLSVNTAGNLRVGFTERHGNRITATERCHVLDPKVGGLIAPLTEMLGTLSIAAHIPQIEVAVGEEATVLLLRVLSPPTERDKALLVQFEDAHAVRFELQAKPGSRGEPLRGAAATLSYKLPESGVEIAFDPADFIQVNGEVNCRLVQLALEELAPTRGDRVLDLFSGLGNFTLPLARVTSSVAGVEGEQGLVERARRNAERNGLANVEFYQADLFEKQQLGEWARRRYDRILMDPPRSGAREIIASFPSLGAVKLVYVSCHPATLARDAKLLVAEQGWRLERAGVLDMFPHTAHVESIAVFAKD